VSPLRRRRWQLGGDGAGDGLRFGRRDWVYPVVYGGVFRGARDSISMLDSRAGIAASAGRMLGGWAGESDDPWSGISSSRRGAARVGAMRGAGVAGEPDFVSGADVFSIAATSQSVHGLAALTTMLDVTSLVTEGRLREMASGAGEG